jgi:hypothetical protein
VNVFHSPGIVCRLVAACLSFLAASAASVPAASNYHGRVSKARAGELVVVMGTEEVAFVVPAGARIRVDGRPGSLEAISKGSTATVVADRFGDVWIARRIDVRLAPKKDPSPSVPPTRRGPGARPATNSADPIDGRHGP